MRIAQVSPLFESVPPRLYGGTERIVSYLTEELVRQGHEVTLFASGDSVTSARLVAPWCCALRLQEDCQDQLAHHLTMLEMVMAEMNNFDIVHYHIDYLHFNLSRRVRTPHVSTMHGRMDFKDQRPLFESFRELPFVSISDSQRQPLPDNNWVKTIYHGLPLDLYHVKPSAGEYLAFIGRVSPEKGLDRAIEAALKADLPIKIAAKVDAKDKTYFETRIKPLLNDPLVEFIGEIGEKDKNEFLGKAMALMFLVDWPEPFGLVMIESMACGTPVIAWRNGSIPEVIDHGKTGFIVDNMEEVVEAISNLPSIDRSEVRSIFERRFSAATMANNYVELYEDLLKVKPINHAEFIYKTS